MRRLFTAAVCAACAWLTGVAAGTRLPLTVPALPPPPPDFVAGCSLPFADIAGHHSIDHACTIAGDLSADAPNQEQNRTKNNFCATGTPVSVTQVTFKNLQAATDALPAPFTFGSHDTLPGDRTPIRSTGFVTTSDGDDVHEGTVVRTVAFLLHGAYSNTGTGEGVNCGIHGVESNDIHLALFKTKPTASSDECQSFTAEITPHARPEDWLTLSTLHKTKTKTATQKIAAADLDRPLRITGQMMMDGSHTLCHNGSGSPKRISVWEIHPVYAVDVCKKKTVSSCRVGVEADWQPLDQWVADGNGNGH
jgi:hypothetical protein